MRGKGGEQDPRVEDFREGIVAILQKRPARFGDD
jgi:hypothetical protein